MVEQRIENPRVAGSIPAPGTITPSEGIRRNPQIVVFQRLPSNDVQGRSFKSEAFGGTLAARFLVNVEAVPPYLTDREALSAKPRNVRYRLTDQFGL